MSTLTDTAETAQPIGHELVRVGVSLAQSQHQLVVLAAQFEASDEWLLVGAPTAAHWIADQLDVCVSTAREWIRIGRALVGLPALEAAFATRRLSYSKVRTLTRVASPATEAELIDLARGVPAGRLGLALAAWSQAKEDPVVRDARHRRERRLVWQVEPDGAVSGSFRLPPAEAATMTAAVDAAVMRTAAEPRPCEVAGSTAEGGHRASAGASGGYPSLAQQRADALVELVTDGGASIDAEVVIHVRGDGCSFDDGTPVTDTVVERIAPDAFIRALVHDADGRPINASARRRHPSARQRRVVKERDRACVDCGSSDLLEYDHEPAHQLTGRTVVDELALRCAPCHRRRHMRESA